MCFVQHPLSGVGFNGKMYRLTNIGIFFRNRRFETSFFIPRSRIFINGKIVPNEFAFSKLILSRVKKGKEG